MDSKAKKAAVVMGYEHDPPMRPIQPLTGSFEVLAKRIIKIKLGSRETENRRNLVYPVDQQLTV